MRLVRFRLISWSLEGFRFGSLISVFDALAAVLRMRRDATCRECLNALMSSWSVQLMIVCDVVGFKQAMILDSPSGVN